MSMEKLRGNRKLFSRCRVEGHGQGCCVTKEMRELTVHRAQENREAKKELDIGIEVWYNQDISYDSI